MKPDFKQMIRKMDKVQNIITDYQSSRWALLVIVSWLLVIPPSARAAIIGKPPANLGLVGYWSMNEGTGTQAGDASGNKNNGTLTGGPTWVDGKRGKALNFDGIDDNVLIGDKVEPVQSISVSSWVKVTGGGMIVSKFGNQGSDNQYVLRTSGSVFDFRINDANEFTDICQSNISYVVGIWYLVTGTYNGSTCKLYMNGVDVTTVVDNNASGNLKQTATNLRIGVTGVDLSSPFTGLIDEVRIYNRALSATEIQALYKSGAAKIVKPAITFDNSVTVSGTNVTSVTTASFTVASSATYLRVGIALASGNSVSSVTSGAVGNERALTLLGAAESSGNRRVEYWYISSPPTGSIKVTVNFAASESAAAVGAASYTGVSTKTPHGTAVTALSGNSVSVNVTSASNEMVVDAMAGTGLGASPAAGQTSRWSVFAGGIRLSAGSDKAGASSVTMTWTNGDAGHVMVLIAVPLKPKIETKINSSQNSKITNGLVGLWSFNGPDMSGATAYDRSGQGNNGTLTNGPTRQIGKIGQALNFDGVNDYVAFGNIRDIPSGDFTITSWFNLKQTNSNNARNDIVAKGALTFYARYGFGVTNTPSVQFYYCEGNSAACTGYAITSVEALTTSTWYFGSITRRGSTARIYLNGSLSNTATFGTGGTNTGTNFEIGRISNNWHTGDVWRADYFNGLIDDVRVYNRALTPAEIKRLYNMGR